ncbi:MAG: hypothetical protein Kow0013_24070 [Pararhodobacter sp.]
MPQQRPLLAETTAFSAIAVSLLCGLAFGASSALLPFIKLNAVVLIGALLVAFIVHLRIKGGILLGLPVSLVSGVVAVVAMWALWFALAHGFGALWTVVQQGPQGIAATIRTLASTTSVSVRMSGTSRTHGPDEVSLVWMIETASMAAAPVLGALASPFRGRKRVA